MTAPAESKPINVVAGVAADSGEPTLPAPVHSPCLVDLAQEFVLCTPALLYTAAGANKDLVSMFTTSHNQQFEEGQCPLFFDSDTALFCGLGLSQPEGQPWIHWDRRLYLFEPPVWRLFSQFIAGLAVCCRPQRRFSRCGISAVAVPDQLLMQRQPFRTEIPTATVQVCTVSSNDGVFTLQPPPGRPWEPPRVVRSAPTAQLLREAQALLSAGDGTHQFGENLETVYGADRATDAQRARDERVAAARRQREAHPPA